jgi:hypothetical protein
MKRGSLIWLATILLSLSSCGSSETYTFAEGKYVAHEDAISNKSELFVLKGVSLAFTSIDKEAYQKASANVIASRSKIAYYALTLSLTLNGTSWDELSLHEIPGSQGRHDNYYLYFRITLEDKDYTCLFRMILQHYAYLTSLKSEEANDMIAMIQAIQWTNSSKSNDYVISKDFSSFSLTYQAN